MVGTQLHGHTQWFSLDECHLKPWGLSTPAVEEVRRLRSSSRPLAAFPHRATPARSDAAVRPVAAPQATDAPPRGIRGPAQGRRGSAQHQSTAPLPHPCRGRRPRRRERRGERSATPRRRSATGQGTRGGPQRPALPRTAARPPLPCRTHGPEPRGAGDRDGRRPPGHARATPRSPASRRAAAPGGPVEGQGRGGRALADSSAAQTDQRLGQAHPANTRSAQDQTDDAGLRFTGGRRGGPRAPGGS